MSLSDIKSEFENYDILKIDELCEKYSSDNRIGVKKLINFYRKKKENFIIEMKRLDKLCIFEKEAYKKGFNLIGGIDEVGRGSLAGPVFTACVILPKDCKIIGIDDSKKLSSKKREKLYDEICLKAISYSIGISSVDEIDNINILKATLKAMKRTLTNIEIKPDYLLVDALTIPDIDIKQNSIIKGDAKSISIAAASIIAKVARDRYMSEISTF